MYHDSASGGLQVHVSALAAVHVATGEAPRLISCQERNLGHSVPPQERLLLTHPALDHAFFVPTLFLVPALVFGNHLSVT